MTMMLPFTISTITMKMSQTMMLFSLLILLMTNATSNPNSILINHNLMLDKISMPLILLTSMISMLIMNTTNQTSSTKNTVSNSAIILIGLFTSHNMLMFYILFELAAIPIFMMITKMGKQKERYKAANYLILYTIMASLPMLIAIINMKTQNIMIINTTDLKMKLPFMMILAFLIKSPMFISHIWLPKAHVEAPMEGSMLLAAILLKLGGLGILRLSNPLSKSMTNISPMIMSISIMGMMMISHLAIRQKDMKALIAYSSVAHMAMTLNAMFSFNFMSNKSAMMMMISHGLTSSAMFFMITLIYQQKHSRNISITKGLLNENPNMTKWLFIIMICNISAPLTLNMMSELLMFTSLIKLNTLLLAPIITLALLTTIFSMSLFAHSSHNQPSMTPHPLESNPKSFMSMSIHTIPLFLMFMKSEMMIQ